MRNIDPHLPLAGALATAVGPAGRTAGPGLTARILAAAAGVGLPLGVAAVALGREAPLAGLAVMALYGAIAGLVAWRLPAGHPFPIVGVPNLVTLTRAALVSLLVAPVVEPALFDAAAGPGAGMILGVAVLALVLDGVDGWAARRLRLASAFGARFDMEVDALCILLLAALAAATGEAGPWVLALGLIRYGFVAAAAVVPALRGALPPSWRRKAVCVLQVLALIGVLLPFLGGWVAAVALAALVWSFTVDTLWLLRRGLAA